MIHRKCGNDLVFLQPPNTKGRGVCIASNDCLRCPARVTPKFIGEVENIGEKVRHMNKWLPVSQYNSRPVLALRNRIVPVLHAPALFENQIRIICGISRRTYTRLPPFQVFVDNNAIIHYNAALCQKLCTGDWTASG